VALLLSLLSDIFLLVLVRFTLRWISTKTNASRIALAILIQAGVFVFLVVAPLVAGDVLIETLGPQNTFKALGTVALLNVFTGLASILFVLMLLFVLLHRVFWPALGRLFYPLARYQLIRNKTFLCSLGIVCLVFAFPWMNTFFRIVQSLMK
jgi:hypothetical protein